MFTLFLEVDQKQFTNVLQKEEVTAGTFLTDAYNEFRRVKTQQLYSLSSAIDQLLMLDFSF